MIRYGFHDNFYAIIERKDGEYVKIEDVEYIFKELKKGIIENCGRAVLLKFVNDILEDLKFL